jgi:hypothetical protein
MTTTRKPKRRRKVLRPAARPMRASLAPPGEFAEPAAAADSDTQGLKEALAMIEIARQKLLEAQARLEAVLRDSIDDAERAEARSGLIVIQRELELLEQRRALLVGGAATLKPPSPADIAAAQSRAAELAQVLAANARVAAVMGLVTDLIRLTEELVA